MSSLVPNFPDISALRNISEQNDLPRWKGGPWPGGSDTQGIPVYSSHPPAPAEGSVMYEMSDGNTIGIYIKYASGRLFTIDEFAGASVGSGGTGDGSLPLYTSQPPAPASGCFTYEVNNGVTDGTYIQYASGRIVTLDEVFI